MWSYTRCKLNPSHICVCVYIYILDWFGLNLFTLLSSGLKLSFWHNKYINKKWRVKLLDYQNLCGKILENQLIYIYIYILCLISFVVWVSINSISKISCWIKDLKFDLLVIKSKVRLKPSFKKKKKKSFIVINFHFSKWNYFCWLNGAQLSR